MHYQANILILALIFMANFGYGQSIDIIATRYSESKTLIESLSKKQLNNKDLRPALELLKKKLQEEALKNTAEKIEGGVDSGGGSLVKIKKVTGLLDLYLYNPKAFFSLEKGLALPKTRTYKDFGFEVLENKTSPLIQQALKQVKKWQASSPFVALFVTKALQEIPVFYVKSHLAFKDQMAFIPQDMNHLKNSIGLGAYYIKDLGVLIEKDSFDGLSLNNQVALLVHEALRHQQMTFDSGMTNEDVQKLTAMIMSEPAQGQSLDRIQYGGGFMLKLLDEANLQIKFGEFTNTLCRYAPDSCQGINDLIARGAISSSSLNLLRLVIEMHDKSFYPMPEQERKDLRALIQEAYEFARAEVLKEKPAPNLKKQYSNPSWNEFTKDTLASLSVDYNNHERYYSARNYILQDFINEMKQMGVLVD